MRRCVFLDRDGVINYKPGAGEYLRRWEEFRLIPAIVDWIRLFNALDFLVVVVTNQRGVALGLVDPAELGRIHQHMRNQLLELGARIDDVFCCPHEDGVCDCRKPQPGLVFQAARKWDIDLERSVMIGDSPSDEELAQRCGMRFIPVMEGRVISFVEGVVSVRSLESC
jgi:histidinol-phosphate phosphatase family protein